MNILFSDITNIIMHLKGLDLYKTRLTYEHICIYTTLHISVYIDTRIYTRPSALQMIFYDLLSRTATATTAARQ